MALAFFVLLPVLMMTESLKSLHRLAGDINPLDTAKTNRWVNGMHLFALPVSAVMGLVFAIVAIWDGPHFRTTHSVSLSR